MSKLRAAVYILSFAYYLVPQSSSGVYHQELPKILQAIAAFLILGVSISAVKHRLVPKFLRPVVSLVTYIPDRMEAEVSGGKTIQGGVFRVVQIFILVFINKFMVRWLLIKLSAILLVVLVKSTTITIDIVQGLVSVGESIPLLLILLLPIIKRAAWYYLLAYFAVCGGLTLLMGVGYFSVTMMIWRNLVQSDLVS